MNDRTQGHVLADVARMIREVIAEEWAREASIGMDTSFARDLEIESIELVALAERVNALYGREINLAEWLAGKDLDELVSLRVGQLVEHIVQCSSRPTTE